MVVVGHGCGRPWLWWALAGMGHGWVVHERVSNSQNLHIPFYLFDIYLCEHIPGTFIT